MVALILILRILCLPVGAQTQVYRSVKTDSMRIALTFDDGPHPYLTYEILDILKEYGISATFFMVGVNVKNYPDAARAVIQAGHEVGNHTYSHHHVNSLTEKTLARELWMCEDVLEELCEYRPHLFRPPQGAVNGYVEYCTEREDYSLILWSLDTRDWEEKQADHIAETVLSRVQPGDIILMHDYIGRGSQTPAALRILLPKLLERGFEPVTVSNLLGN
ncbi:MAG: polysaccharide deacetylase family protein [Clostridia bacterium]|nr:polysaccharide deacetylase family protein [Clostridia bacterium]